MTLISDHEYQRNSINEEKWGEGILFKVCCHFLKIHLFLMIVEQTDFGIIFY